MMPVTSPHNRRRFLHHSFFIVLSALVLAACTVAPQDASTWFKGNLHTHSLWSDGDDFPEMVVDWYRRHGYDFIALSDHNTLAEGEKYVSTRSLDSGAVAAYVDRFGEGWVDSRVEAGDTLIRLRTLAEYLPLLEEEGRFLIIQAEEITDRFGNLPIHVNATNLIDVIQPRGGSSVREVMQNNVDAVLEQRRLTGQAMFPHINHPNYQWAVTAEDMAALEGERFFEVYNGHPAVHNQGDTTRMSTDEMWDVILTDRLLHGREIMYGLATDDAHHYHNKAPNLVNPGRGWIQVRTSTLSADSLIAALEKGAFYASTGVKVEEIRFTPEALEVDIVPEGDVSYRTEFIGTRMPGTAEEAMSGSEGPARVEVGVLLAQVDGTSPRYAFAGNELYVRARIVSSRLKDNVYPDGELEMAWIQPVLP